MKTILYFHALLEVIGGVLFYVAPQYILLSDIDQSALFMTKIYGIMAVIFGLVSLEIARSWEHNGFNKRIFLIIMGLHLLIGFCCYGFYRADAISIGGTVTHIGLCLAMVAMYFVDLPKFEEEGAE